MTQKRSGRYKMHDARHGLSVAETAQRLGISHAMVSREQGSALTWIAQCILRATIGDPTPEQIERLAHDPSFLDVVAEVLREKPRWNDGRGFRLDRGMRGPYREG